MVEEVLSQIELTGPLKTADLSMEAVGTNQIHEVKQNSQGQGGGGWRLTIALFVVAFVVAYRGR